MTKYCCKQSEAFTTGHAGVCMKKAINQRESLREVSANMRGLSLTRLFFAYDEILLQAIRSIHAWSCQCLHEKVMSQLTCYCYTTDMHQPCSHGIQHSSLQSHPHQDSIHQQGRRGIYVWIPKVAHIRTHLIFKLVILRYWLRKFIISNFFLVILIFLTFFNQVPFVLNLYSSHIIQFLLYFYFINH